MPPDVPHGALSYTIPIGYKGVTLKIEAHMGKGFRICKPVMPAGEPWHKFCDHDWCVPDAWESAKAAAKVRQDAEIAAEASGPSRAPSMIAEAAS